MANCYDLLAEPLALSGELVDKRTASARLREVVIAEFDFVWRVLRRLGVDEAEVDDAAQEAFIVASRALDQVPSTKTRSYLFAIAQRVASNKRRGVRRKREVNADECLDRLVDATPGADDLLDERRARQILDDVLETIPFDQRTVFVLFEMEDLSTVQISQLLGIPVGTVASRLRRGRKLYFEAVNRRRLRAANGGA